MGERKYINEKLPIEQRLGQVGYNTKGDKMKIIKYDDSEHIDIEFEDGSILRNKRYNTFTTGSIKHPNYKKNINDRRFIDLSSLPINVRGNIDWFNSIGSVIPFRYEDIIGEVKITKCIRDNSITIIYFMYEDNEYHMRSGNFIECKFGKILNKITDGFKCKIGDIFGEGKIVAMKKEKDKKYNRNRRYYLIRCMNCGYEHWVREENLLHQNYNCIICGDGVSYPEKVMRCILKLLNIEFVVELNKKQFEWCDKYRYDFYLPEYDIIIETHGGQHYFDTPNGFKKSFKEEMINDNNKQELALKHVTKYIVIDCRYSDINWIKSKILESELFEKFNFDIIDWEKIDEFATNSLVKKVCDYYNNNSDELLKNIAGYFNLCPATIKKYLTKGKKLGWIKKEVI